MQMLRRAILAFALIAGAAPAFAQVPPPVPALPDTERRTSYSISGTTCICNVNFALYGDSTDYQNWVEVFLNGVRVNYNDSTFGWTITSPTGPLASIPRPVTDGVLTFTNVQTGTVQIVGARRPRRVSQFNENQGVPARNLNQVLTDIIAQNREIWDKTNDMTGRGLFSQPGNTMGLLPLPSACANGFLGFDATGLNPICLIGAGSGNMTGPVTATPGDAAVYGPTPNKLTDAGSPPALTNNNLSDLANKSTSRTNLGVAIGTNVEAWDADLDCLAALGTTGILRRTGGGTCSAGTVALSDLANGTQDTVIGYFGAVTASAATLPNCTGSLTYSTSAHTFGCNSSAGTGTVTEQKNTASVGLSTSGNCDNISSNSGSPCDTHLALNNAVLQANPPNPTACATATCPLATGVMAGLGSTCHLTPTYSGRIEVTFYNGVSNSATGSNNTTRLFFGTGTAPANGAAVTGTQVGNLRNLVNGGVNFVYTLPNGGVVTGLTPGTAYWFDESQQTDSGTIQLQNISCTLREF